jgi:Zn-finger nucleic acid-binding protein
MDEVKKSGVLIDVCPSCKGVWLDRGELTRLLENIKTYRDEEYDYDDRSRDRDRDYYGRDDRKYDKDYYKHKKKKRGIFGMLEDIFD